MIFLLSTILSCEVSQRPNINNELPELIIDFDSCDPDTGCTVFFPITGVQQNFANPSGLLSKQLSALESPILTAGGPLNFRFTSVKLSRPWLLYTQDDVINQREVPEEWFDRDLSCAYTGGGFFGYLRCDNFYPIGPMQLLGEVVSSSSPRFTVGAQISERDFGSLTFVFAQVRLVETIRPCGNNSEFTTYQNMLNCRNAYLLSGANVITLPKGSGGFGDGNGSYVPFAPENFRPSTRSYICPTGFNCDPDLNWFLVSCPGAPNGLETCTWLSPIITTTNPAAVGNEYDSNGVSMQSIALDPNSPNYPTDRLTKGRLLWSGTLPTTYNFFQANGNNPRNSSPESYNYYHLISNFTKTEQNNQGGTPDISGPLILKPGATSGTVLSITNGIGNINLNNYNAVMTSDNICKTIAASSSPFISGKSVYQWQIPSYPMLYTLTGGKNNIASTCEPGNPGYDENALALCNFSFPGGTKTNAGFRAIDSLPGFFQGVTTPSALLSSSVAITTGPETYLWALENGLPGGLAGILTNLNTSTNSLVRCVSTTW